MRLWHYKLLPYLPNKMIVSQWRECLAIKRQWEKGTLKHPLVGYVKSYNKKLFLNYVSILVNEMNSREINYQKRLYEEMVDFCWNDTIVPYNTMYPEHNNRYLEQCYYNLQEKADRRIITNEEWSEIHKKFFGIIKES